MAIKQIQLRGISRIPSDRVVEDGGCAESLNVHLEYNETAPTLPPDDSISDDIYGLDPDTPHYRIIYIHKMLGVTNYIGHIINSGSGNRGFYAYGEDLADNEMGGLIVPFGESLSHVTSIGNTLIIFTDAKPYYFLYKEHKYTYLGNSVPRPAVEVITQAVDGGSWTGTDVEIAEGVLRSARTSTGFPHVASWNEAADESDECHPEMLATMQNIWGALKLGIAEKRSEGVFAAPFFLRYALRLYDGGYIYQSAPILCGAGVGADWVSAYLRSDQYIETDEYTGYKFHVRLNNLFKVRAKGSYAIANWSDIVQSIDFFASAPIYAPAIDAGFVSMKTTTTTYDYYVGYDITLEGMDAASRDATIRDAVLSKSQFYKIMSIELNDSQKIADLAGGELEITNSDTVSGDTLFVQENMPYGYRDAVQYLPVRDAQNYNNRLLLVGGDELLATGEMFLHGTADSNASSVTAFSMRFKLVNPINGDVNYVMARDRTGSTQLKPGFFTGGNIQKFGDEAVAASQHSEPFAWICYPDSRCTQVEVTLWTTSGGPFCNVITLEKHPSLECAFAFFGLGRSLRNYASGTPRATYTTAENRKMPNGNKLLLSEVENPFVFTAANILTFKDAIIGAATTSVPLSEGQFGEHPMYVFTEGGIRALVPTADGTFAAEYAHPNVSRHVALPGTIMGLEQAVVFITRKGVMLLSGNQVVELSASMNGVPYALDESLGDVDTGLFAHSEWEHLLPAATQKQTLMGFMENAVPAYDNNGARLLFFNPSEPYQYEYRLEAKTWHKIFTDVHLLKILNSYPDCLVSYVDGNIPKVINFSTPLDDDEILDGDNNAVRGIIATRPLDLGAPDVRKSINSIRIRGTYNRADVQYVLLGSFDGIHWQRLTSLRGGSYKLFRIVLLTNLAPMERISWIDIDYETRYTNRLR